MRIYISHACLIGDALGHVPYLAHLAETEHVDAVGDFNAPVQRLICGNYDISFTDGEPQNSPRLDIDLSYGQHMRMHMCQTFFAMNQKPVPGLPMCLDLNEEDSGLPAGTVISPFSRSSIDGNKFWEHKNWVEVIASLRRAGLVDRVYVLGAAPEDDISEYWRSNMEPVMNRPLTEVLNLLRKAPLVLSVDNGISNLCHYGNVKNHVLLYPQCLPSTWVDNPHAVKVTGLPASIQPQQMVSAAVSVLSHAK